MDAGLVPIILVPSTLLLEQWASQVRELLGARVMLAGGGHNGWSSGGVLRAVVESSRPDRPYVVIAVLNSAVSQSFRSQLRPVADRCLVISDEVHRMGSPEFRTILDWFDAPWRLGLSATPERANDPEGTAAVFGYFGGIVDTYSLKDALDGGVLAPYVYHPSWVSLTEDEQERWDQLTTEIQRRFAIASAPKAKPHTQDQLRRKLIERARVAKNAARKVPMAAKLVADRYVPNEGQRWLIYCDNQVPTARGSCCA